MYEKLFLGLDKFRDVYVQGLTRTTSHVLRYKLIVFGPAREYLSRAEDLGETAGANAVHLA